MSGIEGIGGGGFVVDTGIVVVVVSFVRKRGSFGERQFLGLNINGNPLEAVPITQNNGQLTLENRTIQILKVFSILILYSRLKDSTPASQPVLTET